jgi:hypothetical protein
VHGYCADQFRTLKGGLDSLRREEERIITLLTHRTVIEKGIIMSEMQFEFYLSELAELEDWFERQYVISQGTRILIRDLWYKYITKNRYFKNPLIGRPWKRKTWRNKRSEFRRYIELKYMGADVPGIVRELFLAGSQDPWEEADRMELLATEIIPRENLGPMEYELKRYGWGPEMWEKAAELGIDPPPPWWYRQIRLGKFHGSRSQWDAIIRYHDPEGYARGRGGIDPEWKFNWDDMPNTYRPLSNSG